jgi:putative spermidine/putrescine transport system substrate-binding protein
MYKTLLSAAVALVVATSAARAADPLNVVVFGRGNLEAMSTAYVEPFKKATGVDVHVLTYDGGLGDVRAMTKAGKTNWDVLQVETRALELGCQDGVFEKIDPKKLEQLLPDLVPDSISECGVASFVWSQALAYDADALKSAPSTWAHLWDVKRFPGKRGLRRTAKYTLEIALMADGVPPKDVYKVLATPQGVDRAFRKLDQIKRDIVWWEAAQQPSLFLLAHRVVMSSSYTLYVDREARRGKNLQLAWNGNIYDFDHWAIPKGSPHAAEAYRFISFATQPENQKVFAETISYGPVNTKALPLLESSRLQAAPTSAEHLKGALPINIPFWIRYGPALEARFEKWAPRIEKQEVEEHDHDEAGGHAHEHPEGTKPHAH